MVMPPVVFIYEYFTGGGGGPGKLPNGLAQEALGILLALLFDFRRWGAFHIITAFDPRLENCLPGVNRVTLPADEVVCVGAGEQAGVFTRLLERCNAVLIVAPETGGVLAHLTSQAERSGVLVLGSCTSAITITGNKAACNKLFGQAGLPVPTSRTTTFSGAAQTAGEVRFPLVIKPLDGVGSEGVCCVNDPSELPAALEVLRLATFREEILLQAFVKGTHASVSLLARDGCSLPLSLNRQWIHTGCPFRYQGGEAPLSHPAAGAAFEVAQAAVALVPGLCGYVGVDLVLGDRDAWLIEINPRLTTSYIGVRQIVQFNLAQAIWNACRGGILPDRVPLAGQARFIKDDVSSWNLGFGGM